MQQNLNGKARFATLYSLDTNANAQNEFFSMDFSDLQELIDRLIKLDLNYNDIIIEGMHKAADMITREQKRLISSKSTKLAEAIDYDGVGTNKTTYYSPSKLDKVTREVVYIRCGYLEDAFDEDADGFNAGIVGTMYEYGRPGKSDDSRRMSKTMTQVRNGKEVEVSKGTIQPQPHIRRGFDNVKERAVETVIDSIMKELDKAFSG